MRYFSIQKGLLFVGLQAAAFGCASVPDEAPQEFHSAKAALEKADKQDVDNQLPATIGRAESEFKESLAMWKKSRDTDVKKGDRDEMLKSSKEKAVHAQTITEQALGLQDQIKAWDGHIETYAQGVQEKQDAMAQLKDLQAQNQTLAANQNQPQPVAANPDITLKGPVAYFGPNQTDVDARYQDNIDNLARTLKADSSAKVTLSGFADPRGNKALNDKLARERAENVASILKDKGVSQDQIAIEAWPAAAKKMKKNKSQAQLQLDRRVEAYISTNTTEAAKTQAR